MADLEALGLLQQPHTSAGRIPTDLGYRVFVDKLMDMRTLPQRTREIIEEQISESTSNLEEILQRAAILLGRLSSLLGVVLSPKFEESVLHKIDLTRISTNRLLVILAIKSGSAKTIILELNFSIDDSTIEETNRILNSRLSGLTLKEIKEQISERVRELSPDTCKDLVTLFVDNAESVFHFDETGGFYQTGLKKLILQPEFGESDSLKSVIELLEDKKILIHFLSGLTVEDGVKVTIGEENPVKRGNFLSVVSSAFQVGDNLGTINVVGPTRMDYTKLYSIVDYTAKTIQKRINH